MIYVLIAILGFIVYWNIKYKNPYKLIFVFGKKGSGKSTYLVKQAIKHQKKGFSIYTNMSEIAADGIKLINVKDLGEFIPTENSLLIIDEVGMIWDNRKFKEFKDEQRNFFKLQRHYRVKIMLASQTFDVDKKLRDLADSMILINKIVGPFSLARPIRKKIVLTEATADQESRISENLCFDMPWSWQITYIPKYAKYFNSFDTPEKEEIAYTELKTEIKEEKERKIKQYIKNFTKIWKKNSEEEITDEEFDKTVNTTLIILYSLLGVLIIGSIISVIVYVKTVT